MATQSYRHISQQPKAIHRVPKQSLGWWDIDTYHWRQYPYIPYPYIPYTYMYTYTYNVCVCMQMWIIFPCKMLMNISAPPPPHTHKFLDGPELTELQSLAQSQRPHLPFLLPPQKSPWSFPGSSWPVGSILNVRCAVLFFSLETQLGIVSLVFALSSLSPSWQVLQIKAKSLTVTSDRPLQFC